VLELACGSGRVTIPLARLADRLDFTLVGIDLSDAMLAEARRKADDLPPEARGRVTLGHGDVRAWTSPRPFDLVIVPCSTLSHLLSLDDQVQAWRRAHDNLVPGGRFVVDVSMPHLPTYAESMQQPPRALVEMDIDANDDSGTRLVRYRATRYVAHEQLARIHFLYDALDRSSTAERFVSDFDSHVYFPRELELLFLYTGFEIESKWGDYAFGPLSETSRQIVMVGRRPR
jgi:SAM-dependent methyltransferase